MHVCLDMLYIQPLRESKKNCSTDSEKSLKNLNNVLYEAGYARSIASHTSPSFYLINYSSLTS